MFLRNEVNDRLVITHHNGNTPNVHETSIFQLPSRLWLSRRWRVGTEKATKLHEATIRKIANEGQPLPLCRCGQVARQYSNIARAWLCATCYAIDVEEGR